MLVESSQSGAQDQKIKSRHGKRPRSERVVASGEPAHNPRSMPGAALHSPSGRNAGPVRRLVSLSAARDVAATGLALDLVDVGDSTAVTSAVLVLFAFRSDAATTRVEGSHGVDTLATASAREDVAAHKASALAHLRDSR